jgi:tetraacyldisaccharide 4'-kinase
MRAPGFWHQRGTPSRLLAPFGLLYAIMGRISRGCHKPWTAPVPVLCIGNVVAGGAGKTPIALSIGARLSAQGRAAHFLTRGYGGRLTGPVRVDKDHHDARDVGDEPLLLADVAPTWVARNRAAAAGAAIEAGADVLVMDDGLQHWTLAKTNSFLVVDGEYGFGNEGVIPSGPLRETIADALRRTDEVVIVGPDKLELETRLRQHVTVLNASFVVPSDEAQAWRGRRVVAFAGIARPAKFLQTLVQIGCEIVRTYDFADHHVYSADEVMDIVETANGLKATPVTTAKDVTRLPALARQMVKVLPIEVAWQNERALDRILDRALAL